MDETLHCPKVITVIICPSLSAQIHLNCGGFFFSINISWEWILNKYNYLIVLVFREENLFFNWKKSIELLMMGPSSVQWLNWEEDPLEVSRQHNITPVFCRCNRRDMIITLRCLSVSVSVIFFAAMVPGVSFSVIYYNQNSASNHRWINLICTPLLLCQPLRHLQSEQVILPDRN